MEKITLPNGFRIMLEEVEWAKSCSMGVWIGSGSRFETPEHAGVSHFIEHMLFKGTEKRSSLEIARQMDEIGGTLNAYTSKEYTCVYVRSLSDHVNKAFDIIGDMLTAPKLDPNDLVLEKGVITEEIAMYEDSPEDLCMDLLYDGIWSGDMIGNNILGSRQTVEAMTKQNIQAHMEKYYVPDRMVASFCGKFDKEQVIDACTGFFGSMKPGGNPVAAVSPSYSKCIRVLKKEFEQTQIALGLPGISSTDDRRFSSQLFCSILGAASSSRLFQRLREDLGLVYSIEAFNVPYLEAGVAGVSMGLSPKSEKQALDETLKILQDFTGSITGHELARAQEQAVAGLVMGLESTVSRAVRNGRSELLYNCVSGEDEIIDKIRGVTPEQINKTAGELLDFKNLSLCAVGRVNKNKYYDEVVSNAGNMV